MICDMTARERYCYFQFHGEQLAQARAQFAKAVAEYGAVIQACAASERPSQFSVEGFVEDVMARADRPLAEEVTSYLEVG